MSMTLFTTAAIAAANKGERYRTELRVGDLEVRLQRRYSETSLDLVLTMALRPRR
jgi:hypothetical protein